MSDITTTLILTLLTFWLYAGGAIYLVSTLVKKSNPLHYKIVAFFVTALVFIIATGLLLVLLKMYS